MTLRHLKSHKKLLLIGALLVLSLMPFTACGGGPETFTIGVINLTSKLDPAFEGLKTGLAELGYVDDENVSYIYEGEVGDIQGLEGAVQDLIAEQVDLIFSITTPATIEAKRAVEGTDTPVIFIMGRRRSLPGS